MSPDTNQPDDPNAPDEVPGPTTSRDEVPPAGDPPAGDAPAGGADRPAPEDAPTAVHAAVTPPPPGLYRSESDRMLFGVCGGIAERYGLEPLLVRLAFLATLFIGGAGVLFYLAAALLIPISPAGVVTPQRPSGPAASAAGGVLRVLVALAAAIGVFAGLCAVAAVSFGFTVFFGAWPVAVVLLILAALLVVSARSRRTTGALLIVALALAVPATAAVVGGVEVERSVGDRQIRPFSQARASAPHHLGVGRMVLDLRRVPLHRGDRVRIPARVDVGQLAVVLPRTRCVAWTVRSRIRVVGDSDVLADSFHGPAFLDGGERTRTTEIDPPRRAGDRRPRVTLDLRIGVGSLVVADTRKGIDGGNPSGLDVVSRDVDLVRTAACRTADRRAARG
ncbi:PspC domain-containing protein [Patulibacter sp. NPDC049589]|uniref:PspC domain-containing protein n=1 Tax=Patulibacter sp. NPDC049589 TaxID=3154731 RepID=UPI00343FA35D